MAASNLPIEPVQLLPREAYVSSDWFEREREHLFSRIWTHACISDDLDNGQYVTLSVGNYPLVVIRGDDGELRAFHNICRHRGTELFEGTGKVDGKIICPYHRWTYAQDGTLEGVPNHAACFPDLDRTELGLLKAGLGEFKGIVFVHPDSDADFESYLGGLREVAWPHEFHAADMVESPSATYEMRCNWKVFYENAIDGYHLGYLHDNTLGPVRPDTNVWDAHGKHLIWYSTDTGEKRCLSSYVENYLAKREATQLANTEGRDYAGVYMMFPNTIVTTNPFGMTLSRLIPTEPGVTLLVGRSWHPASGTSRWRGGSKTTYSGYDPQSGYLKLESLERHALETGDFHWEDVWICEKVQRSLSSPAYKVNGLARGAGAESSLAFFQQGVLDYVDSV